MKNSLFGLLAISSLSIFSGCDAAGNLVDTTTNQTQNIELSIPASATAGTGEVVRMQPNDDLKAVGGFIKSIKLTSQKVTIVAPAGTTFDGVKQIDVFINNPDGNKDGVADDPIWVKIGSKTIPAAPSNIIDLDMTLVELKDFVLIGSNITYKYTYETTAPIPSLINLTAVNNYQITVGP